jgi:hypothetical protein
MGALGYRLSRHSHGFGFPAILRAGANHTGALWVLRSSSPKYLDKINDILFVKSPQDGFDLLNET